MRLKDLGEDCELCPVLKAELCTGGFTCYGGQPIEPPCCSMDEDTDLDQWVEDALERQRKYEEYLCKKEKEERLKKEKAKKAADTRHRVRIYCMDEIVALKQAKKQLQKAKELERMASSYVFAVNATNEMFRYDDRVKVKPELSEAVKLLEEKVAQCEAAYKQKKAEFYQKRKAESENE